MAISQLTETEISAWMKQSSTVDALWKCSSTRKFLDVVAALFGVERHETGKVTISTFCGRPTEHVGKTSHVVAE